MRYLTFLGRRWRRDLSSGGPRTVRACTDSGRRTSERGASVASLARSPAPPGGSARRPGTRARSLNVLPEDGAAHAHADAEGGQAVAPAALSQAVGELGDEPDARRRER